MSLTQGGVLPNVLQPALGGGNTGAPTAIIADPTIPNAATPTEFVLLTDYTLQADGGALSRPTSSILASFTLPLTLKAGTRCLLALCEVQALINAGAAGYS